MKGKGSAVLCQYRPAPSKGKAVLSFEGKKVGKPTGGAAKISIPTPKGK